MQIEKTDGVVLATTPDFPAATLVPASDSGFLVLGAEIDRRPPIGWGWMSARKTRAVRLAEDASGELRQRKDVVSAAAFRALLVPPGRGRFLRDRPEVPIARFDLVLLVEFVDLEAARTYAQSEDWCRIRDRIDGLARRMIAFTATNPAQMGPVERRRDGVYLFNWFYADDPAVNLAVWKGTAGWFERTTDLHNSVPMRPDPDAGIPYTLVNHCRWDRLADILPAFLRRSFRSHVLASFERHRIAAIPILYRMV